MTKLAAVVTVMHERSESARSYLPRWLRPSKPDPQGGSGSDGFLLTDFYPALGPQRAARLIRDLEMDFDSWEDGSPHSSFSPVFFGGSEGSVRFEISGERPEIERLLALAGIAEPLPFANCGVCGHRFDSEDDAGEHRILVHGR